MGRILRVGLIGDFRPDVTAHVAIPRALELAGEAVEHAVEPTWLPTPTLANAASTKLSAFDALWCVPASPYESMEGALSAIQFAREDGRPYLGTCGGYQHAIIEYARNVLGLNEAEHAESAPDAAFALIAPLACSLIEVSGQVQLKDGSRVRQVYGRTKIEETYHCRFGLPSRHAAIFSGGPLRITGTDSEGEPRVVELDGHPFFIATAFQPERRALHGEVPALVAAFVRAAASRDAA
jgi:CTP synthase (UTP-ammonia lyase)